jgi:cytochrome P450
VVRGQELEAGQRAFLVNLAANRDPAEFADPDRFDVRRNPKQHLGFGYGVHYCLGAPLARLESQVAIAGLLGRFRDIAVDPDAELSWHATMLSRGLRHLPVSLRG